MSLPPVLFLDLDDTILADSLAARECWRIVCEDHAARLQNIPAGQLYDAITQTGRWYWSDPQRHRTGRNSIQAARREVVTMAFNEKGWNHPQIAIQLADDYTEERRRRLQPFAGALETLDALHGRGVSMALLTNGEALYQREKIERFGLEKYFGCIVIEGEFGAGKPDETVFRHALRTLSCEPADVWMVGDNLTWDIAPALKLGMQGIWVDHARKGLSPTACCEPSRTIHAITELLI